MNTIPPRLVSELSETPVPEATDHADIRRASRREILAGAARGVCLTAIGTVASVPLAGPAVARMNDTADERYQRGMEILKQVGGAGYDVQIKRLAEVAPDLARFTVEYPYGDVLSRPGLDLPRRQICTVSALIANGNAQPQLKYHMNGFLNVGGTPRQLVEVMFVSIPVCGFTAAINSVGLIRDIFKERNIAFDPVPPATDDGTQRHARGLAALEKLSPKGAAAVTAPMAEVSPDLARWFVEVAFGELLSRDGLDAKSRQLAIISMLGSTGNRTESLRFHIDVALRQGVTRVELTEAMTQLSVYAGFPAALNAFGIALAALKAWENGETPKEAGLATASSGQPSQTREARRARGIAALAKTSGAAGDAVVRSFDDVAPDIGRLVIDFAYGDVFMRPAIDPKVRELAACSALAAIGSKTMETPLRVHVTAALNAGATREEIVETLLNLVPYCGFPAVQQATQIAGDVFAKRPN